MGCLGQYALLAVLHESVKGKEQSDSKCEDCSNREIHVGRAVGNVLVMGLLGWIDMEVVRAWASLLVQFQPGIGSILDCFHVEPTTYRGSQRMLY